MTMSWCAAFTKPHMELWARSTLWERGFEVYLPQYLKLRRHARQTAEVARPLFPRYLFLRQPDGETLNVRAARMAGGVVDLVRMGDRIPRVPDRLIAEIRSREDAHGHVKLGRRPFNPGDRVRLVAGSMCDQIGLFECREDAQRVIILIDLLGRQVRTRVSADSIAPEGV